jgi:hypothetical protein
MVVNLFALFWFNFHHFVSYLLLVFVSQVAVVFAAQVTALLSDGVSN